MTTIIAVRLDQPDLIFPLTERQLSPDKLPITPDGVIHDRGFPELRWVCPTASDALEAALLAGGARDVTDETPFNSDSRRKRPSAAYRPCISSASQGGG